MFNHARLTELYLSCAKQLVNHAHFRTSTSREQLVYILEMLRKVHISMQNLEIDAGLNIAENWPLLPDKQLKIATNMALASAHIGTVSDINAILDTSVTDLTTSNDVV